MAKEKPERGHLRRDRTRTAHASDHGAVAGAHRHQAAAGALRGRAGAGDERRDERARAARARRLCRPRGRDQGRSDQGPRPQRVERLPGFENMPTVAETIPNFFVGAWTIMLAPSGTPDPIIRKVSNDLWTALNDPEVKDQVSRPTARSSNSCRRRGTSLRPGRAEDVAADPRTGGEGDASSGSS